MPEHPKSSDKGPPPKPEGLEDGAPIITEQFLSAGKVIQSEAATKPEAGHEKEATPTGETDTDSAEDATEPDAEAEQEDGDLEDDEELSAPGGAITVLETESVIVYVDRDLQITMDTSDDYGEYPAGVIAIWPDVKIAESRPAHNLTKGDRKTFLLLVARALGTVAEKDGTKHSPIDKYATERLEGARRLLREADTFRSDRLAEVSRRWLLLSSTFWWCFWLRLAIEAWFWRDAIALEYGRHVPLITNCIAFGISGAFVSVCLRLGKLVTSPESGGTLHFLEAGVRLVIGGVAALAVYFAVSTGIMLKDIATTETQLLLVYLVSLVAGLSERALPALATQVPGGLAKDLE